MMYGADHPTPDDEPCVDYMRETEVCVCTYTIAVFMCMSLSFFLQL